MRILAVLSITIVAVGAQVNCNGGALNAGQRGEVVSQHNRLRSSIARGASSPGPRRGQNIYALSYDCTLEAQAQAQANRCVARRSPLSSRFDAGENFYMYTGNAEAAGAVAFATIQWWNQIFRGWTAGEDNMYTSAVHATGIDMYAQIAWVASTRIGCGVARCGASRSVVCQYRTGGPQINQVMVQNGPGCTANEQCTTFPNSTCDVAMQLCQVPANTDPIPPPTTMTSTGPTTTTTLSPLELCTVSDLLTAAIRQKILDTHNAMRSLIAKGQRVNTIFTGGCKNMFALKYECALEEQAKVTAEACGDLPAPPEAGQNVYVDTANLAVDKVVQEAMKVWTAEVASFKAGEPLKVAADTVNRIATIGRFAQMAHSSTSTIGCYYGSCEAAKALFVCKYVAPRGALDSQVYVRATVDGCRNQDCKAVVEAATCNRSSGLCEIP